MIDWMVGDAFLVQQDLHGDHLWACGERGELGVDRGLATPFRLRLGSPEPKRRGDPNRYDPTISRSSCLRRLVMATASSLTRMTMLAARSGIQQAKDR